MSVRACVRACVVVVSVDFCLFVLHIIDKSAHNCEKECMDVVVSWSLMFALVFLTTNIFLDRSVGNYIVARLLSVLATISLSVFCVYNAEYPFGKRA